MKAELDTIVITIRKREGEWPSAYEQQLLVDDIEHEFDVVDIAGPFVSGEWSFTMRERDIDAVVNRINELIREHTGR